MSEQEPAEGRPSGSVQTFEFVTLFPEVVHAFVSVGLMGKAIESGRIRVFTTDPRQFTTDKHRSVDDAPFGGGAGMVMSPEPVAASIEQLEEQRGRSLRVLVTPSAPRFDQGAARQLARHDHITFLCGRYEGIDDRIREQMVDRSFSLGDFVLNGGEVASLAMFEAIARLRPGVLGNPESIETESFAGAEPHADLSRHADQQPEPAPNTLLEHPHYTRPANWRGHEVPSVLRSGDHQAIARWRLQRALKRTHALRPELRPEPSVLRQQLPSVRALAVLLPPDFDRSRLGDLPGEGTELGRGPGAPRLPVVWVGGEGQRGKGRQFARDLRQVRDRMKRQLRELRTLLRASDGSANNAPRSKALWTVGLCSAGLEASGVNDREAVIALKGDAFIDFLLCEHDHGSGPGGLLFVQPWPGVELGDAAPQLHARLALGGARDSSPQKDRKRLAIESPLIDISQPAGHQVEALARAIERSLNF